MFEHVLLLQSMFVLQAIAGDRTELTENIF
jgi:hypothetical protein